MFGAKKLVKKSNVAIGVDVGNFAVKVVQIHQENKITTLEGFGYYRVDSTNLSGIVEAIKNSCAEAKLTYKLINSAIGAEGSIVRYFMLPEMNTEDLKKAMEFEIERYVPFDKKDVVSDYMVLKEGFDSKNMKVLLVAAKKDFVDQRVRVLKDGGLDPEVITIDSIVLKNVFQANYPDRRNKTIGLINVGAKVSNINIVRDNTSFFMRDVQLGGESITNLLKEKLDVELIEAEKIKCNLSVDDKDKFKAIEPVLGNLLNEIYLSFDYYESEFGMVVDEVFLSGGSAKLPWLASFLKENLNREVSILNPANHITIAPTISKQRFDTFSSSLVVSIGLALESFI